MEALFESIFSSAMTPVTFLAMLGTALLSGILFSFVCSFRMRSSKRFFITTAILPSAIAVMVAFVSGGSLAIAVSIGGAFALVRFRSAQGSADEITTVFLTMAAGVAFGMGYLAYGALILIIYAALLFSLANVPLFSRKNQAEEKLLKITIPESLDYSDVFDATFLHYLKESELVGVKTTNMGSMFKLSYRVKLKNAKEEKELIDELRTKNGNLEISLLPYVEQTGQL